MRLLLKKELKEGWRSFRLPGLLLLGVFFALLEPPTQKYMDEIMAMFAEGIEITMPAPTPEGAFMAFAGNITSIFLIAAIIVFMGLLTKEQRSGISEWILTRPISRKNYILAKQIYLMISTVLVVGVSSLICALFTYTLLGALNVTGFGLAVLTLVTIVLIPLVITFMTATITSKGGAGAAAGIGTIFIFGIMSQVLTHTIWLPSHLSQHMSQVLYQGSSSTQYWLAVGFGWLIIVVAMIITNLGYQKKEL